MVDGECRVCDDGYVIFCCAHGFVLERVFRVQPICINGFNCYVSTNEYAYFRYLHHDLCVELLMTGCSFIQLK